MVIDELERALGHSFEDRRLLLEALTHATWLNERHDLGVDLDLRDQQRLEFLGDAFLGFAIAHYVYQRFPDAAEGELTDKRKSIVKGEFIRAVGNRLEIEPFLRLGAGETVRLGLNKKVVEDTVEALVGAILEDAGTEAAHAAVQSLFLDGDLEVLFTSEQADPIVTFNARWQQVFKQSPPKPIYSEMTQDDALVWQAEVTHPDGHVVVGSGGDQKQARRHACAQVLRTWLP